MQFVGYPHGIGRWILTSLMYANTMPTLLNIPFKIVGPDRNRHKAPVFQGQVLHGGKDFSPATYEERRAVPVVVPLKRATNAGVELGDLVRTATDAVRPTKSQQGGWKTVTRARIVERATWIKMLVTHS